MKRAIEATLVLLLIGWRVFRKSMDGYGLWADWLLVAGVLWLLWLLIHERKQAARGPLFFLGCAYLFFLYGYFQLGSSVSLISMILNGM